MKFLFYFVAIMGCFTWKINSERKPGLRLLFNIATIIIGGILLSKM